MVGEPLIMANMCIIDDWLTEAHGSSIKRLWDIHNENSEDVTASCLRLVNRNVTAFYTYIQKRTEAARKISIYTTISPDESV